MKYYSEMLNKLFNSAQEVIQAEEEVKKAEAKKAAEEKAKKEARATRAKEVEDALKEANKAQTHAIELLKAFTKDYGYFHTSYSLDDADLKGNSIGDNFFDLLNVFLD